MPAAVHYEPSRRTAVLLLVGITVLAAALRLTGLSDQSIWFDEAATAGQVSGSLLEVITRTAGDNYPPLYNLIAWPFSQPFGGADWSLRLPAALLGIVNVPVLYLLVSRVGGRSAGLVAALLLTLSSFHLWYSHEARMYSLLALAATSHALAVLCWLERQSRRRNWALVLSGAALLLSHPYGALVWFSIAAGALLATPRPLAGAPLRSFLRREATSFAIFALWGLMLLWRAYTVVARGSWLPEPTPGYLGEQLHYITGGLWLPLLLGAALTFYRPAPGVAQSRVLFLLWALAPIVAGALLSMVLAPVFVGRYFIGCLPAMFALAALGISPWIRRPVHLVGAMTLVVVAGVVSLLYASPPPRPNWRAVVQHVVETRPAESCAFVDPGYNGRTWSYFDPEGCRRGLQGIAKYLAENPRGTVYLAIEVRTTLVQPPFDQIPNHKLVHTERFDDIDLYTLVPTGSDTVHP